MAYLADDILIVDFDECGRHHDQMVEKVQEICRQSNLKLNKDMCLFRCTSTPFFGEIMSQQDVSPKPNSSTKGHPPLKMKKELKSFLGVLNYLSKFSPMIAEVCEPLHKMTLVKVDWIWHSIYQDLYEEEKTIIKRDVCMKLYDAARPLYLETHTS